MDFKVFGEILCDKTLTQMRESMDNPFVVGGALMPDAHAGYSLPIGGVVMTEGCIVPAWPGFDLGCGMRGIRTNIHHEDVTLEDLEKIKEQVLLSIPMGNSRHKSCVAREQKFNHLEEMFTPFGREIFNTRGLGQLGTLGGGNHFVEIGYDKEGWVWVCIHSGSRGVGHAIASHYMKKAAEEAGVLKGNVEGAFPLWEGTALFKDYKQDLDAASIWATYNRMLMAEAVIDVLDTVLNMHVKVESCIDNIHNEVVSLYGGSYVHRKGATSAATGEFGIIPGNMRDGFFVVRGLGNTDSMCSASHGAGRVMSRGEAKAKIDFNEFQEQMKHVVTNVTIHSVDEAPDSYKDIFEVMDSQKDCVEIVQYVKPLLNLKG